MGRSVVISKERLKELYWGKQLRAAEIAPLFGCSPVTIINRMREHRIRRRIAGPKRVKLSRDTLCNLYLGRSLSAEKISRILHCEQTAVLNGLRRYKISVRHPKALVSIPKEALRRHYLIKCLSTYKIARRYRCDPKTIYKYLKFYNIPTRPRKKVPIAKNKLLSLYTQKKYSLSKIAQVYNCHPSAILKKMRQYGIVRRTIAETSTKHKKKDFDGDSAEKAYMIGFRLGDLGVCKEWNLIHIGCGTTKTAQLNLIQELFKGYGPGWVTKKDKKGRFHINFALNRSFKFLLPKHYRIPRWIMKSKKLFLQFLAGYTDAEGNIGIYSGRARLRIRSYDYGILEDIHRELLRWGITSIFSLEKKPGIDKRGVRHNGTCWGVAVNIRKDLRKLLGMLSPLLRHQKRSNDSTAALQNVILRLR